MVASAARARVTRLDILLAVGLVLAALAFVVAVEGGFILTR
jgi:hypothetical protein